MRYRAWATGGVAVALVVAAAGCSGGQSDQQGSGSGSGGSGGGSPAKVVQAAYRTTTAAHTAKIGMKTTVHAKGRSVTVNGHGVTNFDKKKSKFTMELPQGKGSLQMRYLDQRAYEKLPSQAAKQLGSSTPWVSFDVNALAKKTLGASVGQLSQGMPSNPSAQLGYLRGVSEKGVHKVGSQQVHGVPATHYKATIDLDKALGGSKQSKQAVKRLEQVMGSHTIPMNLWLDKKGRVVQMKFTEKLHPKAAAGGAKKAKTGPLTMDITESLSDYGTPVHITAPPKDQTTDVTDKIASKAGGNGH